MTTFALAAISMIAIALAWVLIPLVQRRAGNAVDRSLANAAILRNQRAELDAEFASGAIAPEHYDRARLELERRVLDESQVESATLGVRPASLGLIGGLGVGIPIAAAMLYLVLGSPGAIDTAADSHLSSAASMDDLVDKLAARLVGDPTDAKGWHMLARSYATLHRFELAVQAYDRVAALNPNDADILADYADVLATTQGGAISGRSLDLVKRALAIDPKQWKALALAGTEAFDRRDYVSAIGYWERAQASAPSDSSIARSIAASIAEARDLGSASAARASPKGMSDTATSKTSGARVAVDRKLP